LQVYQDYQDYQHFASGVNCGAGAVMVGAQGLQKADGVVERNAPKTKVRLALLLKRVWGTCHK
jgi:hypothetical protein